MDYHAISLASLWILLVGSIMHVIGYKPGFQEWFRWYEGSVNLSIRWVVILSFNNTRKISQAFRLSLTIFFSFSTSLPHTFPQEIHPTSRNTSSPPAWHQYQYLTQNSRPGLRKRYRSSYITYAKAKDSWGMPLLSVTAGQHPYASK